jgi:hypothetical protein
MNGLYQQIAALRSEVKFLREELETMRRHMRAIGDTALMAERRSRSLEAVQEDKP